MTQLDNLDKSQLEVLHKQLVEYRNLSKKMWKRGRTQFSNSLFGKDTFVVEYHPSLELDYVETQAQNVYSKAFTKNPSKDEISFVKDESLLWGMKVYCNDFLVDLSFLKFYNALKK